MILLLSALAFAEPEDIAPACDLNLTDVVPAAGSLAVPVDTVVRVQATGTPGDPAPVQLSLIENASDPVVYDAPMADGSWRVFSDVTLQVDSDYDATFSHPDMADVFVSFSTSMDQAEPPEAPQLVVSRVVAVEAAGDRVVQYLMTAEVQATLTDTSGASTASFSTLGVERSERAGSGGIVPATITWYQDDPEQACVSAVAISPTRVEGPSVEVCRDADEVIVDPVEGCACSASGGSAAWWILLGLPLVLRRRR